MGLFGSTVKVVAAFLAIAVVTVAAGFTLGVLGAPSVAGLDNQFGEVTADTTEIRTDLVVHNPNPFGVSLGGVAVEYDVLMNDVEMANGTKEGVSVGSGNTTMSFTTLMDNDRIPTWWASHVRNDERSAVRVDATVRSGALGRSFDAPPVERRVSTDVLSGFNSTEPRPIDANAPVVSDPVAYVNETGAKWGEVTDARTPIDTRMVVYNAKAVPMAITEIGYTVTMNGVEVGDGSTEREHVVEGHTTETIRTTTAIDNDKLDEWWVTHLDGGQVTDLRIDFYAEVEVAGATIRVPLEGMTYEKTIETDVFGSKGGSTTGSGPDSDGASDDVDGSEDGGTTDSGNESPTTAEDGGTTTTADGGTTTTEDGGILGGDGSEGTTTDDGILALAGSPSR